MAYTQSAGIANIDALMTFFKNALTSNGWTHFAMNTSSLHPNTDLIGRQDVFRINGTTADPTKGYVTIYRDTQSNCCDDRIKFISFSGEKGFSNPIIISQISRSTGASTIIQVTCSAPHNLVSGDHVIINGTPHSSSFHEGWITSTNIGPGNGGFIITTTSSAPSTNTFTYLSLPTLSTPADSVSGGYVLAVYNPTSDYNSGVNNGVGLTLNDANMACFMYYDEWRMCGLVNQGGTYQTFYLGEVGRDHVPQDFNGRAFLLTNITAGAVTASLDRDVANIRTGQRISFVHPSGSAGTGSFERVLVTSKPTSSSFGCVLSNSYPSGTLVGEDPLPLLIFGGLGTSPSDTFSSRTARFIFHLDMTRDPTSPATAQTMTQILDTGITESYIDPDSTDYHQGRDIFLQRGTAPTGIRGRMVGFVAFPISVQNDQDIMRTGGDAITDDYKAFVSLSFSSFLIGIGPGAT